MKTKIIVYSTPEEVSIMLKVSVETCRRWVRDGKLRAVKLSGRLIRISPEDLKSFIKSNEVKQRNLVAGRASLTEKKASEGKR